MVLSKTWREYLLLQQGVGKVGGDWVNGQTVQVWVGKENLYLFRLHNGSGEDGSERMQGPEMRC